MGQTSSTFLPRGSNSWRLGAEVRGAENRRSLTLEATTFNHTVHTALFGRTGFPPPAAGAEILARSGGPGAGRTTNARIASVVKWVVRHVVGPDIVPDLLFAPVGEWIHFDQTTVLFVHLDFADGGPGSGVIPTEASNPGIEGGQDPTQGKDLAHLAAQEPQRRIPIKQVDAVPTGDALNLGRLRKVDLDLEVVLFSHLVEEFIGLLGEPAGVDSKHPDLRIDPPRHVEDRHAIGLKAGT